MPNLGMGVMIGLLGGNADTVKAYHEAMGKTIANIQLDEGGGWIRFGFADGTTLTAADEGQSCCEIRYMRTDDDLFYYVGARLTGLQVKNAPNEPIDYGAHEVQFLEVQTDKGVFTLASHNEHNGYYGGFWVTLKFDENTR